jgi:hypothetical protein
MGTRTYNGTVVLGTINTGRAGEAAKLEGNGKERMVVNQKLTTRRQEAEKTTLSEPAN